jgi:hypothetical protein
VAVSNDDELKPRRAFLAEIVRTTCANSYQPIRRGCVFALGNVRLVGVGRVVVSPRHRRLP